MRSTFSKLVLLSTVAAASFAAHAATSTTRLQVPFNFTVGGQNWPAGDYTLQRNAVNDTVVLRSTTAGKSSNFMLQPGDPSPSDNAVALTFSEGGEIPCIEVDSVRLQGGAGAACEAE